METERGADDQDLKWFPKPKQKKNGSKTTAELFSGAHGRLGTGRSQDTPWTGQRLKRINHSHSSTRTYVHLEASVWQIRMFLDWSTYKKKVQTTHRESINYYWESNRRPSCWKTPWRSMADSAMAPDAFLMCSSKKEADNVWLIYDGALMYRCWGDYLQRRCTAKKKKKIGQPLA